MNLKDLAHRFSQNAQYKAFEHLLDGNDGQRVYLENLQGAAAAFAFGTLTHKRAMPLLFILNDEDSAGFFYQDLVALRNEEDVLFLPSGFKRNVKFGRTDEPNQILRTEVMGRLADNPQGVFIVTYPEALAVRMATKNILNEKSLTINTGDQWTMDALQQRLLELDFHRTEYVYEPGQFSIRGSIMDIFSYSLEYPLRIDFFGDDIDSIRTFDVETQLSREKRTSVTITAQIDCNSEALQPFWALLPHDTVIVMQNNALARDTVRDIFKTGFLQQAEIERNSQHDTDDEATTKPLVRENILYDGLDWDKQTEKYRLILLGGKKEQEEGTSLRFCTQLQPTFHKNMSLLSDSLLEYQKKGYDIYLLADDVHQYKRLKDIFDGMEVQISLTHIGQTLHQGFADDSVKACLFTDHQIFDRFHRYALRNERARNGKTSLSLRELRDIEPGDYVVHMDLGIGRYEGLVMVQQGGTEQEYIKLTYKGGDVVHMSVHSLAKLSKYKGKDGTPPQLNRLGTGAWNRIKDRTKKQIKDIARDLIKLYAQRRKEKGFAFSPDSYLQYELEASFVFEDTPDQKRITQEVKADMESEKPMDRLVCGDVGFGKTEIAIRAAYKAAADGKQVAVLVPTTVLAYQHYQTFTERLKDFGVSIAYLTRAQNAAKVKEIREGLGQGKIDIVIGTQKLLGKTIQFKDLGLLVIDEEQKFGVSTKERLRQMRVNIDTLTMSATPIPRTLQFSLMGARDLSVLRTPPANRLPIHTEVHLFGHEVICDAIEYEMSRGGQAFVVCNKISSLPDLEVLIHKHIPDARIAIGHGQMPPEQLEKIIFDFINHEYDVLLSTTIVENGIDIPNANTIVIVDAHRYGLSDLHQMRGRVGRSNRKAFCYLLAPPFSYLTPEARHRLEALENFSGLGDGLQIALQDLDIRGAGNLLGAEQSGFIADLGYETYQKVLSEAVSELKNDEFADLYADENNNSQSATHNYVSECNLETDMPLYFSEEYIPGSSERMECYRQLYALHSDNEVESYRNQLIDRFGQLPPEAESLLKVSKLRRLGCSLGMERIVLKQNRIVVNFVSNKESAFYKSPVFGRVLTFLIHNPMRGEMKEQGEHVRMALNQVRSIDEAIALLTQINQTKEEVETT